MSAAMPPAGLSAPPPVIFLSFAKYTSFLHLALLGVAVMHEEPFIVNDAPFTYTPPPV
ncbi:MAG: hypothetical protein ACTTJ1_06300 [Treponema sp.]